MVPSSKMEPKKKRACTTTCRDRRPVKKRYQPKLQKKKTKENDSGGEKSIASALNENVLSLNDGTAMEMKQSPPWYAGTPTQIGLMDDSIPTKKSTDSVSFKDHCPSSIDTDWLTTMNNSLAFDVGLVPSPPPLLRSVAQVLPLSIHRSSDCYPRKVKVDCTMDMSPEALSAELLSGCSLLNDKSFIWDDHRLSLKDDTTKLAASPSPCSLGSSPEPYMGTMALEATDMPPSTLSTVENQAETTLIPASFLSGKIVPTQFGLAMVIVPSADVSTMEYNNAVLHKPSTHNKRWSQMEDDLLKYAVSRHEPPYPWQDISQSYFPTQRSANQCKSRWTKIDPKVVKAAFKPNEDAIILDGQEKGLSWPDIAKLLPGRSTDQVRSRFLNAIDPSLRKHVSWTTEEEIILREARLELGNKWSVIAQRLPGRSENDVKNHWYSQKLKVTRQLKSMAAAEKRVANLSRLRIDTSIDENESDNETNSTSV